VYKTPKTLWQHWDTNHKGEAKPQLWKVHLVAGMKLEHARTAPWVRVEHALSSHSKDYATKNMREEILDGRRELERGTYVELQPASHERSRGDRWFAVVRDGRVRNDEVIVEHCDTNSQNVSGVVARVYVQSILKVGPRPHIRFSEVHPSTPQKRDRPTGSQSSPAAATPKSSNGKRPKHGDKSGSTLHQITGAVQRTPAGDAATRAPYTTNKRHGSFSPTEVSQSSPEQLQQVISPSAKKPRPTDQESTAGSDESSFQHHEQEISQIESHIKKATKNNSEALQSFRAANKLLTNAGWGRCITMEQMSACSNIQHPEYSVLEIPRDGKCMYHCLLGILKAEQVNQAPETPEKLRKVLATYVQEQDPPPGEEKCEYGGIWAGNEYLRLEEALESTYGGEAALAVFVQVYDVTIHCHAPESRNEIQVFEGSNPQTHLHPQGYHLLQTYSWLTWIRNVFSMKHIEAFSCVWELVQILIRTRCNIRFGRMHGDSPKTALTRI
jgi:hypothetical protein